jgi:TraM recognition site of TraD and TraG/Type IV secretion-system coupling protein DNA-binding domain
MKKPDYMLFRTLEYFLISIFNRARRRREGRDATQPVQDLAPPPDYTILGHLIPDTEAPAFDPTTKRLSDAGVVALSPEARMRHLYLLGATGTGKTNLLLRLIESDIRSERAFCVIDLRGDLVDRILLRLAAAAPPDAWRERLLLVDLRDGGHTVGFNPLHGSGDPYARALLMLSVLKKQSDSWGVQLEDTLRHSLMALAEAGWSLLEVRPLLNNAAFREQVLSSVRDSQVRSFFEEYSQLSAAERGSRSGAVLNKLSPLLSVPALRLMFGQRHGFSFSELLDTKPGMVILVSLGVDRLHDAARLAGGLLVASIQTAVMARVDQPEDQRVPVHLYVDEFENMASDKFKEIVAEGRRFRVGLTLSHQNLSQLPASLRDVIRSNVHTQVYFQTGAVDAGELAKEIGHGKGAYDVRAALMSQPTGEAFLVRRAQASARMRTLRSADPQVEADRVQRLRAVALAAYARQRDDVERELEQREAEIRAMGQPPSGTAPGAANKATVYEIRHDKVDRFAPGSPQPGDMQRDNGQAGDGQPTDAAPDREASEEERGPAPDSGPLPRHTLKKPGREGARKPRANTRSKEPSTGDKNDRDDKE